MEIMRNIAVALLFCTAIPGVTPGQTPQPVEPKGVAPKQESPTGPAMSAETPTGKPRVFMQSQSHGNMWNAERDQSMEMSKDFEKECPGVRVTLNQQMADYTVALNHIEVGFSRDNQFQIADRNGDLLSKTKEGGSINKGVKKACAQILADWNSKVK
jgi:hypothetical protein